MPPGLIQFAGPRCCLRSGSKVRPGASDCAPELTVASRPLGRLLELAAHSSPTTSAKAGCTAQMFVKQRSRYQKYYEVRKMHNERETKRRQRKREREREREREKKNNYIYIYIHKNGKQNKETIG